MKKNKLSTETTMYFLIYLICLKNNRQSITNELHGNVDIFDALALRKPTFFLLVYFLINQIPADEIFQNTTEV